MAPWNPDCYLAFKKERFAPFEDLLPLIRVRPWMKVVDLGCGTGELTKRLAERLPDSDVLGIDTSEEMLEKARELERPGLRFEKRDLRDLEGQWDLVFSHATIHWVEDHHTLIRKLFEHTRAGGPARAAVPLQPPPRGPQARPRNGRARTLQDRARGLDVGLSHPPRGRLRRNPVRGGRRGLRIFEKVYPHVMESADALSHWLSGTTLVPYLERLDDVMREYFMQVFRSKLRALWPAGPVFYPFRRTFISVGRSQVVS